jgi:hypothetical protein
VSAGVGGVLIPMVQEDLGGFGDARSRRVGARLLEEMGASNPRPACMPWRRIATKRLFWWLSDQSSVSHGEMLTATGGASPAGARLDGTCWRSGTPPRFNFPGHVASKSGFGGSVNDRDLGLSLHPTIPVDAVRGGMIGLGGARVSTAPGTDLQAAGDRGQRSLSLVACGR